MKTKIKLNKNTKIRIFKDWKKLITFENMMIQWLYDIHTCMMWYNMINIWLIDSLLLKRNRFKNYLISKCNGNIFRSLRAIWKFHSSFSVADFCSDCIPKRNIHIHEYQLAFNAAKVRQNHQYNSKQLRTKRDLKLIALLLCVNDTVEDWKRHWCELKI